MRQLFPTSAELPVDLAALYGSPRPAVDGRPWVGLCMIASLDGAIAVDGRSGGLGNDSDRAVFRTLRAAADVILIGAKTAATEHYGPPSRPGQRIGVVTSTGTIDTDTELFTSGSGFLVLPEDGPPAPPGVDAVRAGNGSVDLATALRRLDAVVPAVGFVQAEGGPRLNGALADAGCIDELDLSIAPGLVGGESSRLVAGATESLRSYRLAHVLADDDGYLFTRWLHRDRATTPGPC
jgi:riboflavin biosynthesis pyrimidine reductase